MLGAVDPADDEVMTQSSRPKAGSSRYAMDSHIRSQPEPSPPFQVELSVRVGDTGVYLKGTGLPRGSSFTRMRFSHTRITDLADLLSAWLKTRRRWAGYQTARVDGVVQGCAWFRPHRTTPLYSRGREAAEIARRAAVCEWVPCFDELFLDWEVSGLLVSANDEAVGAAVRGPGSCVAVLTRGVVVLCARGPARESDLAVVGRWLVQDSSELDRFRLAELRGHTLVIDAAGSAAIEQASGEFSSLRRIAAPF